MSLIQEALKRKDGENSDIAPKAIPMIPPTARELPIKKPEYFAAPSSPPVHGKTIRTWPVLVVSLIVIATLVLAAVGLLLYSARSLVPREQQAKAVKAAVEIAAPWHAVPTPVLPPDKPAVAAVPKSVRAAPVPILNLVTTASSEAAHAAVVPVAQASSVVAAMVIPISTGVVKEGTMEDKPNTLQSSWPTLKVLGVMARAAVQDWAAIVDDNLVECGDEIRGVKVRGMEQSGVWFEFNSQTQFVRVGQTTL